MLYSNKRPYFIHMEYNNASFGRSAIIRYNAQYLKWNIIGIELSSGISY